LVNEHCRLVALRLGRHLPGEESPYGVDCDFAFAGVQWIKSVLGASPMEACSPAAEMGELWAPRVEEEVVRSIDAEEGRVVLFVGETRQSRALVPSLRRHL
jgi:hypothetical protein